MLLDRVRSRLAAGEGPVTAARVAEAVRQEGGALVGDVELLELTRALQRDIAGAGPLEPLLADPSVTDVLAHERRRENSDSAPRAPVASGGPPGFPVTGATNLASGVDSRARPADSQRIAPRRPPGRRGFFFSGSSLARSAPGRGDGLPEHPSHRA